MSIQNIKELLSKRVLEADRQKLIEDSKETAKKRKIGIPMFKLSEVDAGITEYFSKDIGFQAVIKQRFSDFQVHEIDKENIIVRLTNTDIPEHKEETINVETNGLIDESTYEKVEKLIKNELMSVEIDVSLLDKDQRRDIHKVLKSKYGSKINSNTSEDDQKKLIIVTLGKATDRKDWPAGLGKFLHFVLYKSNTDTMEAINILSQKLRIKSANFGYAGTKDKRGKTTQWVSLRQVEAKKLDSLNKFLRCISVGNYIYKDEPLKLGDLKGNNFEIVLRNVMSDDETITKTLNIVKDNGFINYFGLQRFGNSKQIPTYEIGKALIKGDFKTAVELILKPRDERSFNDLKEAREVWWETRDANKAFKVLQKKERSIEGKLLSGLVKHGKNAYVNALENIPRSVRLLYLHSYQSIIWNKILSKRIQKFGNSVIEGDLVFKENGDNREFETEIEAEVEVEVDGETKTEVEADEQLNKTVVPNKLDVVKTISEDEIHQYTIYDIVHPLPGYNVDYPDNIIKNWYEEMLEEDGLSSEKFKQSVKQYALSGTYRHIVKKMKDLTWKTVHYSDPDKDLILSDTDKLSGLKEEDIGDAGEYKAVVLNFSLDSSTYATMALREILRIDTSSSHQASLNSYSNKRPLQDVDNEEDDVKRKKETNK